MRRESYIIYGLLKRGNSLVNNILKNPKRFILMCILFLLVLVILKRYKRVFMSLLMIVLGALSLIHSRYIKKSYYVGFELCTLATVLITLAYGYTYGMITGFLSITLGFILNGSFKHSTFISILVLPLMALIVPLLTTLPLTYIGLIITIIYDIIILPLYMMMGSRLIPSLIFFLTHMFLNYWIFSTFGMFFYNLLV